MPANRGRASIKIGTWERDECLVLATAWSSAASPNSTSNDTPNDTPDDLNPSETKADPQQRAASRRKKGPNHIPRPPNAFILFRSSFIKKQHVSTEVETNHSTLSKIIGLTWKNLSEAERQKWHAQARVALDEHKRQFPEYAFRPVHTKTKGSNSERRKLREVGPKDQKRCAKIAELLACGKTGQELEEAIQEFDKHHVPEIITRFDTPITASSFETTLKEHRSVSPVVPNEPPPAERQKSRTPLPSIRTTDFSLEDLSSQKLPNHSLEPQSLDNFIESPSLDYDTFSFSVDTPHSFPMGFSDVNYAIGAYDVQQAHSPMHLSPATHFPEEWLGRNSPLSATSNSMPTTPLQLYSPFDQFVEPYHPGTYPIADAGTEYMTNGGVDAYCEPFATNFPPYSTPEPPYNFNCLETDHSAQAGIPAASGFALDDGRFHLPPIDSSHLNRQLDFSSAICGMDSLISSSYL